MKKFAFTMLELVFVIVVIGIIAAMVIPRIDRDNVAEAATQLVNHIKYTQHLAMTEDIYDDQNQNWPTNRWQIQLFGNGCYAIHSNSNGILGGAPGAPARADAAIDPQTRKTLFSTAACTVNSLDYERVYMNQYFDIQSITTSASCNGLNIGFDNIGRPYDNLTVVNGVLKQDCDITITAGSGEGAVIRITPETGYTYILNYF